MSLPQCFCLVPKAHNPSKSTEAPVEQREKNNCCTKSSRHGSKRHKQNNNRGGNNTHDDLNYVEEGMEKEEYDEYDNNGMVGEEPVTLDAALTGLKSLRA
eukprot:13083940-Ditylum_brightwellii.AAC.1